MVSGISEVCFDEGNEKKILLVHSHCLLTVPPFELIVFVRCVVNLQVSFVSVVI